MLSVFNKAIILFEEKKFAECKEILIKLASDDEAESGIYKDWIAKCDSRLQIEKNLESEGHLPIPNVRFSWFQSPTHLKLTYFVKNRRPEDVNCLSTQNSIITKINLGSKEDQTDNIYEHKLSSLFDDIVKSNVIIEVKSVKVEISAEKTKSALWPSLENTTNNNLVISNPTSVPTKNSINPTEHSPVSTAQPLKYPNNKGVDWSKFDVPDEEIEEKPVGDHALNALFKQIYGNGTDDQRRAMMKSFTESNGTVLSTNWNEIGSKKVECEAPKGMEVRHYNE